MPLILMGSSLSLSGSTLLPPRDVGLEEPVNEVRTQPSGATGGSPCCALSPQPPAGRNAPGSLTVPTRPVRQRRSTLGSIGAIQGTRSRRRVLRDARQRLRQPGELVIVHRPHPR